MYLCKTKTTLVLTAKIMKELNELEKTELTIERFVSVLNNWEKRVKIMKVDPQIAEKRRNELLEQLSEVIKKRDYLKK